MDADDREPDHGRRHADPVIDVRRPAGDDRQPVDVERTDAPSAPDHLALLQRARAIEEAAFAADPDAVHRELRSLRAELDAHLLGERDAVDALPPVTAKVIADGQRHLRAVVDRALRVTSTSADADLVAHAASIEHWLVRQAKLEARVQADLARRPRRHVAPDPT